jgi:hypothetical protein
MQNETILVGLFRYCVFIAILWMLIFEAMLQIA